MDALALHADEAPSPLDAREPFRPGRWVAGLASLLVAAWLVRAFAVSPNIQWEEVGGYLTDGTILRGLELTIFLSIVAQALGIVIGVALAAMRLSPNPVLNALAGAYVYIFRGTPALLQIIFWFNLALVFPTLGLTVPGTSVGFSTPTNTVISSTVAAILALGLNEGAYMAEIVRGGVESVDGGQTEAAAALGLRRGQRFRHVVLPQALRAIVPPTGNEFVNMLKSTSLVSVIAAQELLNAAQTIYARNFLTIELLIVASVWYLVVTTISIALQARLERRLGRGDRVRPASGVMAMVAGWRSRRRAVVVDWDGHA